MNRKIHSHIQDDFRQPKTAEEHSETSHTEAVSDIDELVGDFWPEDESADDFISYTYGRRREDRERGGRSGNHYNDRLRVYQCCIMNDRLFLLSH